MNNADLITWKSDDLPRFRIDRILGNDWVEEVLKLPPVEAVFMCLGRAQGCWDANLREEHAAYRSLARLLGADLSE